MLLENSAKVVSSENHQCREVVCTSISKIGPLDGSNSIVESVKKELGSHAMLLTLIQKEMIDIDILLYLWTASGTLGNSTQFQPYQLPMMLLYYFPSRL